MIKEVILSFSSKNGGYFEIFNMLSEEIDNEATTYVLFIPEVADAEIFKFNKDFCESFIDNDLSLEMEKLCSDFIETYNKQKLIDEDILKRYKKVKNVYNMVKQLKNYYDVVNDETDKVTKEE